MLSIRKLIIIFNLCFFTINISAFGKNIKSYSIDELNKNTIKEYLPSAKELSPTQIKYILDGKTIANSASNSPSENQQNLDFYISKLHPLKCESALLKLSTYEKYKTYIGVINESKYDDKKNEVYFLLKSPLLPYNMHLKFQIPRIKEVGLYPFVFKDGIFANLRGNILALNFNDKCLIYSQASWEGTHTKIPSFVIEVFSETLSKLTMEKIFRATSI